MDKLTATQLWEMAGFPENELLKTDPDRCLLKFPKNSLSEFAYKNKMLKELADQHYPKDFNKNECEKFNITTEQWAAQIEIALRARTHMFFEPTESSFCTKLNTILEYYKVEKHEKFTGEETVKICKVVDYHKGKSFWKINTVDENDNEVENFTWIISIFVKAKRKNYRNQHPLNGMDVDEIDNNDIYILFEYLRKNNLLI